MVRMTMTLDERLLREAQRLSGARTKRQTMEAALAEYVSRLRRKRLIAQEGSLPLTLTQADLRRWRELR